MCVMKYMSENRILFNRKRNEKYNPYNETGRKKEGKNSQKKKKTNLC